jgi:hypothetical protein
MNPSTPPPATPVDAGPPDGPADGRRTPELAEIRQRLDWLFRNAQPSPAMKALRDMVQRYREAGAP